MNRAILVAVGIVLIALAVLMPSFISSAHASSITWAKYNILPSGLLFYQINGTTMLIALPSNIISNYKLLNSPYPSAQNGYILNVNSTSELVLQDGNIIYIYKGMKLIKQFNINSWAPGIIDLQGNAIAFGNYIIYNNTAYSFAESDIYPIIINNEPYALYNNASGLFITNGTQNWMIYPEQFNIISAYAEGNTVYILANTINGNTVYIINKVGEGLSGTAISGTLFVNVNKAWGFLPAGNYFIASGNNAIYKIGYNISITLALGNAIAYNNGLIFFYNNGFIYGINPAYDNVIYKFNAPENATPVMSAVNNTMLALAYNDGLYVSTPLPSISINFYAPAQVYAGQKFEYNTYVSGATNVTVTLNGVPVNPSGYIAINKTGVSIFKVFASNSIETENYTAYVNVNPDPLILSFNITGNTNVYSFVNVSVNALDTLNNEYVKVPCNISINGETINTYSSVANRVELMPTNGGLNEEISAVCGGGMYQITSLNATLTATPLVAKPVINYLGNGRIMINMVAPQNGNINVPGAVTVYLNNNLYGNFNIPAYINVAPGNNTIKIMFTPSNYLYAPATYTIYVAYIGNISKTSNTTGITVANVVQVENRTVIMTEPRDVYITEQVPVPKFNVAYAILFTVIGIIGGIALGLMIYDIKKNGIKISIKLPSNKKGENKEGSADVDYS